MNTETITLKIEGDENGAIRLCCPICNDEFKVYISDWDEFESDTRYCAICGLESIAGKFYPQEIYDVALGQAQAIASAKLEQMIHNAFKGNKSFKTTTVKTTSKPQMKNIETDNTNDADITCNACKRGHRIPNFSESQKTYCPYCGELV